MLIGVVPPLRGVGCLLKLTPYLPVAFHGILPAEKSQWEHTRIAGDGSGRVAGTSAV
jgi:hypothetical protein